MMSLFSIVPPQKLQFTPIDPLGDGLGEEIQREQSDPDNIAFQQDIDGGNLTAFWSKVEQDIHSNPDL